MNNVVLLILPLVATLLQGCLSLLPQVQDDIPDIFTNGSYIFRVLGHDQQRYRRLAMKSRYVYHNGVISNNDRGSYRIRVDSTYSVSDHALNIAACTTKKMTQHMPSDIFNRLATSASVGVFTKAETLTVFPEYAAQRNPPGCGPRDCTGACQGSCTNDGLDRKYESLAGTGGVRGVAVDDNVLCNQNDPYHSGSNILVHEFAHTIKNYGLSSSQRGQVDSAYHHAKSANLWSDHYPLSTVDEYFAVGTSVFFNTDRLRYEGNGNHMDLCHGSGFCNSEYESRTHIYRIDNQLYNFLVHFYLNNDVSYYANIGVCGGTC